MQKDEAKTPCPFLFLLNDKNIEMILIDNLKFE